MKCVFCEIAAGREPASVIYSDPRVIAFMGVQPAQSGECMVIPREHIDHFSDLSDDLAAHVIVVAQKISRKVRQVFSPRRVGLVVHGFGVPHAHLLIVPQHNSDDITSGRFARIDDGKVVFDMKNIPVVERKILNEQAKSLRIDGDSTSYSG